MRWLIALVPFTAGIFAAVPPAPAEAPAALFPFVVRWDDVAPGSAVNMSYMNAKPAGANGRIVVRDGHFVESATGQRIKFLGVNFTADADFPTHSDADKVAVRLARMGVNLVRIHHHDIRGVRGQSMLWAGKPSDPPAFSAEGRERLDYLIAQLKKRGIYVNLNLHVSRAYLPSDGFPDSVLKISGVYDKQVDVYDRHMIALQKQFAHDYLTHVNPYTGMSYVNDPCVAVVEINNENSLVNWPGDRISFFDQLPEPFRGEIVGQWNSWLARKYGSDSALRTAWKATFPAGDAGATPVLSGSGGHTWRLEDQTKQAKLVTTSDGAPGAGPPSIQIDTSVRADQDWGVQAQLAGLDLKEGTPYLLTFRARANAPRTMTVSTTIDQPDWHNVGFAKKLDLRTDWQQFRMMFTAAKTLPLHNRLDFTAGNFAGTVWLSDVRLRAATFDDILPPDRSISAKNIDIPRGGARAAVADWTHFLVDTEQSYADEMRSYLRRDLRVKACIVDTQMGFGGLSSFSREAGSDFADAHTYWQSPKFPRKNWDRVDWQIGNTPMVTDWAAGKPVTLNTLAFGRVAGKPFSVSEYNHPAPSDYQVEMMPLFSSYAALQDWDMIYAFEYGHYNSAVPLDQIQWYFAVAQNPAKETFFPSAALILRAGDIPPLPTTTILNIAPSSLIAAGSASVEWPEANGGKPVDLLASKIESTIAPGATVSKITVQRSGPSGDSSAHISAGSGGGASYTARGDAALVAMGYLGGQTVNLGPMSMTCPAFGNNFAAITLASVDRQPLKNSHRLLLTIVGRAENLDMQWNKTRTSVADKWGHGPSQAEGIPATITLNAPTVRHVWALDAVGARSRKIPVTVKDARVTFAVGPEYKTVWYEITAE